MHGKSVNNKGSSKIMLNFVSPNIIKFVRKGKYYSTFIIRDHKFLSSTIMRKRIFTTINLSIIIFISLLLLNCVTIKPARDAVALPENLSCQRCKPLQEKYLDTLLFLSNRIPFKMKTNTMGFIEWKDSIYFSIELIGGHYNTINTTTITRLSNEFHEKFQDISRLILKEPFINEIAGFHIVLICTSTNFVTDKYGYESKPNTLEIFTLTSIIKQFLNGDITGQDFLDNSKVFVDAERTRFKLELM